MVGPHMPSPAEIAARDARRLAVVLSEIGGHGAPVGAGWMACDVAGSWAHYAAGLGLAGPVADDTLNALVAFYRARGRTPTIQVTPYQHPSLLEALEARGFTIFEVESVLWRPLEDLPPVTPPPGLTFRPVRGGSAADVAEFVDSQFAGFFPDQEVPPGMRPITARVATGARSRLTLLERDGTIVGSGGIEPFEDVAVLIGGCVAPAARRQGVQAAFIRHRLHQARGEGASYATIGSTPGGPTERNALRAGFRPAYTQIGLRQL